MSEKLSVLFDLQMGKTPPRDVSEYWNDGSNRWISIADLSTYSKYVGDTKETITDLSIKKCGIKSVPPNTVIMSFKLSIGKVAITIEPVYTNEAIMAFIDKGVRKISSDYLYYLFSAMDWSKGSNKAVKGITLNKAVLSDYEIDLPDFNVQCERANRLTKAYQLIVLRKKQLERLDDLIKSQFLEMFGVFFDDVSSHEKLKAICAFIDYRGKTPEKSDSGIPLITAKNVRANAFSVEPQEFIPTYIYDKVMTRGFPKHNDVLFTTEAPLGNVCKIPAIYEKFCVGQRLITMQPKTGILTSEYLEMALLSDIFQEQVWKHSSGSTVKGIRSKELVELTLPVPPIALQNRFAEFVQQVDKSKFRIQQSLEKLELCYNALMQEYFG